MRAAQQKTGSFLSMVYSLQLEELFDSVLERVFIHLGPQHGAIFLKDGDGLIRVAVRSSPDSDEDFPESSSLAREVVDKRLAAIVLDTETDTRFAGSESLLDAGVRTLIAAPLLTPDGALGMIVLSSNLASRQFVEQDMELLVVVASATRIFSSRRLIRSRTSLGICAFGRSSRISFS